MCKLLISIIFLILLIGESMRNVLKLFMFIGICITAFYLQIGFCQEIAVSEDSLFFKTTSQAFSGKPITLTNISDDSVIIKSVTFTCHSAAGWWLKDESSLPCSLASEDSLSIIIGADLPTRYAHQKIWLDSCFIDYGTKTGLVTLYIPQGVVPILSNNNQNSCNSDKPAIVFSDQSFSMAKIHYTLISSGTVRLILYNVNGKKIRTLVDNYSHPGSYEVICDYKSSNDRFQSSGIHFAMFTAETQTGVIRENIKLPFVK